MKKTNTIYKVEMVTDNPSENKTGFFSTKEKVEKEINRWKETTKKHPDYYGDTKFHTYLFELDTQLD